MRRLEGDVAKLLEASPKSPLAAAREIIEKVEQESPNGAAGAAGEVAPEFDPAV